MSEQRKYEHDATKGATRYPPDAGEEYGGRHDERDPHSRLNTPVEEVENDVEAQVGRQGGPAVDVQGMGGGSKGGGDGDDPELPEGSRGDREARGAGQATPRGMTDAEAEAVRRAEEATGVPLDPSVGRPPEVGGG
jgi:hypothetical protein